MHPLFVEQQALRAEVNCLSSATLERDAKLEEMVRDLTISTLHSRWIQRPNYLSSRKEIGYWLNFLGLNGEGVEVGVFKGQFSFHLLKTWDCRNLNSVDPWREFSTAEYVDVCNLSNEKHERNFQETCQRLERFGDRSQIIRKTSAEAAKAIEDHSLEFVYLDAQHHYEAVRDDIKLWYPKVKPGGVLGGHDYLDGKISSGLYGVKKAVQEFVGQTGCELIVTREPSYPSWFSRIR